MSPSNFPNLKPAFSFQVRSFSCVYLSSAAFVSPGGETEKNNGDVTVQYAELRLCVSRLRSSRLLLLVCVSPFLSDEDCVSRLRCWGCVC